MSPRLYASITLGLAFAFGTAFACLAVASPRPHFIWNATPSAPIGLYYVEHASKVQRGDLIVISPPPAVERFLADRHYVPKGIPLIKRVAATPGERICRWGPIVTVSGNPVAVARARDRFDRPLPLWSGCKNLAWDELFVLNKTADSLDGRYFGALPKLGLIGRAYPLLTRAAQGEALRWRAPEIPNRKGVDDDYR